MFRTASKATMSQSLRPYHVPKTKIAAFSCFRQWPISRFFDFSKAQVNILNYLVIVDFFHLACVAIA